MTDPKFLKKKFWEMEEGPPLGVGGVGAVFLIFVFTVKIILTSYYVSYV